MGLSYLIPNFQVQAPKVGLPRVPRFHQLLLVHMLQRMMASQNSSNLCLLVHFIVFILLKGINLKPWGGMFQTGVCCCNGCGCHPIIGPQVMPIVERRLGPVRLIFASHAQVCTGNVTDYIRIDHPMS